MEAKRNKIVSVGIVALILASSPAAAMAQSDRQKDKNNMRNLGAGLGGAALYELMKGNGTAGLLLGAGAAYAGKKYEDARKAQSQTNRDRDSREHTGRYNHTGLSYSGDQGMTRSAPQPIDVLVNKEKVAFPSDRGAEVIGGNTYVPLRGVMEKLGAQVNYNPDTKTVTAMKGDKTIKLPYNDFATVNGKQVKLDAPAFITNGQTMIPLRFMAQTFGANVNWDADDHAVHIDSTGAA